MHKSMSLKYEPSSEPLHISAKYSTQDSRADLAIYSPPLGPHGFPSVGSYVNVDL